MRIVLYNKGFIALRNSPAVVGMLTSLAQGVAARAGEGFETRPTETDFSYPKGRARAAVVTATSEAMQQEAKDRTLTRAFAPPWKPRG